jgi:cell division septation protein DedD
MEPALKTRLIGAAVLIVVAVIVVPMFFSGQTPQSGKDKTVSLAIPAPPDQALTTRTMSVATPATAAPASSAPANSDQLATVNVASRVPPDVHPELTAKPQQKSSQPASQTPPGAASNTAGKSADEDMQVVAPKSEQPKAQPQAQPQAPGRAAHGRYQVNMGAYASSANARDLVQRIRKLGYPVMTAKATASGKTVARIGAGPFATRAAAEAARLKLKAAIPSAPASLVASAGDQHGDAPAKAQPAHRAGGWAVQIGAYSHKSDAQGQVDKLRKAGFDGYLDDVRSGGKTLWRVRVGPQTQRADAQSVRDDIKTRLKLPGVVVTVP